MSQKKLLAAALVAGTAALAGCDPTGAGLGTTLPVATPTPAATATPIAFAGFPSNATVTGRVLFEGGAPGESLNIQYKTVGGSRSSVTADSDKNGYFSFSNIPDAQAVQLIWDDGNASAVTDADFNVAGLFVSAPVVAKTNPDKMNPMVTMDIKWKPAPTPALNAKTNGTFSFTRIPNLEATYEIAIFDTNKSAKASKVVGDGATSADLTTVSAYSSLAAGNYLYQIKFYAKNGTFGGSNLFGSTKYMPFQK
ncbi:MAG: hypothetical protein VKP57_02815 [Candidatus Sericytochromatia bacterium]|nr:hypothetical protein [Candidatus Sericytochromatia bacterium]